MVELPPLQFSTTGVGCRIAWREWGSGLPLVMLHGWSMSSVVFAEVAATLASEYRILCPDLPGHGGSEPLNNLTIDRLVDALADWLRQQQLQGGALLGWSLGGQVAMRLISRYPQLHSRLILVATTPLFCCCDDWPHGLPTTQVRALERNIGRAYEKAMGDFFRLQFVGEELSRERYRQIIAFAVRTGRLPEPAQARETLRLLAELDLRASLPQIALPTLVMHGELDQIVPFGAGNYLAEQLPQAQLCRLTGVGHAPFFSRPTDCVEQWREFLA